jgi:chromosome segregation ATPase
METKERVIAAFGVLGVVIAVVALFFALAAKDDSQSQAEVADQIQTELTSKDSAVRSALVEDLKQTSAVGRKAKSAGRKAKKAGKQAGANADSISKLQKQVSRLEGSVDSLTKEVDTLRTEQKQDAKELQALEDDFKQLRKSKKNR